MNYKKNKYYLQAILANVLAFAATVSASAQNPYINKVYEYRPAPGQFVNKMPFYEEGDTEATMAAKATEAIANDNQEVISLGAFGGYVVFGFDHPIVNVTGAYDFQIDGNAFYSSDNPNPDAGLGGSSEPGIVMVSRDMNGNGLPDDTWYELAGSEYHKPTTRRGYSLTYQRPAPDHVATPKPKSPFIDTTYIHWTSNLGEEGYIVRNSYNRQEYYPNWISEDKMTFTGTCLPENAVDESGKGTYYVLYCFPWGYADNHPNNTTMSQFNIDWAVDADGNSVFLSRIDFIKVYTGINQQAGILGETSTEISGACDLHPQATTDKEDVIGGELRILTFEDSDCLNGNAKWSSLIDDPQYGGPLLYGDGFGFYDIEEAYKWYDEGNTFLCSTINEQYDTWCFWSGGVAISNWYTSIEDGEHETQLGIPYTDANGKHGRGGSENFAVGYGYEDTSGYGSDTRPIISFGDGKARIIDHAYITNTAYFLHSVNYGDGFNEAATDETFINLVAQGFDEKGDLKGTVKLPLIQGTKAITEWTRFNLSSLGKILTLKFDFEVSEDQQGIYGVNVPAYFAIDDIAVRMAEDDATEIKASASAAGAPSFYSISGTRQSRLRKGINIIVRQDGSVRKVYSGK